MQGCACAAISFACEFELPDRRLWLNDPGDRPDIEVSEAKRLKALEEGEPETQEAARRADARCGDAARDAGKKLLTPSSRRQAVTWAIAQQGYSQRRACGLIGLAPKTYRYRSRRSERRRSPSQAAPARGRAASLRLPAPADPAAAGGCRDQSQETVPALSRGTACEFGVQEGPRVRGDRRRIGTPAPAW